MLSIFCTVQENLVPSSVSFEQRLRYCSRWAPFFFKLEPEHITLTLYWSFVLSIPLTIKFSNNNQTSDSSSVMTEKGNVAVSFI